jgi:hypothetical protein
MRYVLKMANMYLASRQNQRHGSRNRVGTTGKTHCHHRAPRFAAGFFFFALGLPIWLNVATPHTHLKIASIDTASSQNRRGGVTNRSGTTGKTHCHHCAPLLRLNFSFCPSAWPIWPNVTTLHAPLKIANSNVASSQNKLSGVINVSVTMGTTHLYYR